MKYIATFIPQVWTNDNAMAVTIERPRHWDVTAHMADHSLDDRQALDGLTQVPNAPFWVRTWPGPFEVVVNEVDDAAAADLLAASNTPSSTHASLASSIPDADGRYGRGFRDALESVQLALISLGLPTQMIGEAIGTALDAYGNNADDVDEGMEIHEVLVCSTAHLLPGEQTETLGKNQLRGMCTGLVRSMSGDDGYLVYIPSSDDADRQGTPHALLTQSLSNGFAGAMQTAAKLGMNFVRFECDGRILPRIETYDDDGNVVLPAGHLNAA